MLFQVKDSLSSLTDEILKIGSDKVTSEPETSSEDAEQSLSTESSKENIFSSGTANKDKREKAIEDYPRPLAVVGVSVL